MVSSLVQRSNSDRISEISNERAAESTRTGVPSSGVTSRVIEFDEL